MQINFTDEVGSKSAPVGLIKNLDYARQRAGLVYLWPDHAARKGQQPLTLRLIISHNGKHPVHLVTRILDPQTLSDAQLVEIYTQFGNEDIKVAPP